MRHNIGHSTVYVLYIFKRKILSSEVFLQILRPGSTFMRLHFFYIKVNLCSKPLCVCRVLSNLWDRIWDLGWFWADWQYWKLPNKTQYTFESSLYMFLWTFWLKYCSVCTKMLHKTKVKKLKNYEILNFWTLNMHFELAIETHLIVFCSTKGQTITKANYGFFNSSKKRTKLTILSREDAQDSEFRSFFGRIEDTINCFRDLLT